MTLPITFNRAASAEFIEATAWYDSKRLGRYCRWRLRRINKFIGGSALGY